MSSKKIVARNSSNDGKHPYLVDSKWIDGTLCFWRDSPGLYSKATIERLEESVRKLKEKTNKII